MPAPVMPPVPKAKWLLYIYSRDVWSRLDEVKAVITSTFGEVLKMDSTKQLLVSAKRAQMEATHLRPSDSEVREQLSRKELSLHCRRQTRGTEETSFLLKQLLQAYSGDAGRDTLGVPLLDTEKVRQTWSSQERHIRCLQDPDGYSLYTRTGYLTKGGIKLPMFRCARGSTSLESFHLHINRFIPGEAIGIEFLYRQTGIPLETLNVEEGDEDVNATVEEVEVEEENASLEDEGFEEIDPTFPSTLLLPPLPPPSRPPEKAEPSYDAIPLRPVSRTPRAEPSTEPSYDAIPLRPLSRAERSYDAIPLRPVSRTPRAEPCTEPSYDAIPLRPLSRAERSYDAIPLRPVSRTPRAEPCTEPSYDAIPLRPLSRAERYYDATPQLPPLLSLPVSHTPRELETQTTSESTDVHCVSADLTEGMAAVDNLAHYLVSLTLESQSRAMTDVQATEVIRLWDSLSAHDRLPTKFPARYRTERLVGRFKRAKAQLAPGVESVRRCFTGENAGPAQNPNCNRYVESIMVKLCARYPAGIQRDKIRTTRFSRVMSDYRSIREMVLSNQRVVHGTGLQLFDALTQRKAAGEGCPWPGFVAVKTTYGSFKSPTTSQGPSDSSTTGHQRGGAAPVFASAKHCRARKNKGKAAAGQDNAKANIIFLGASSPIADVFVQRR
ncbi:hypothetical protein GQR58_030363 [Nymphon striatum]|nr:hypothetical protein GQR58_030363 [Nymphon striatum]